MVITYKFTPMIVSMCCACVMSMSRIYDIMIFSKIAQIWNI